MDTNKVVVGDHGTLFLAGASLRGSSLRRLEPGGRPSILLDDLRVSDVAALPDGSLVATVVEPGFHVFLEPHSHVHHRGQMDSQYLFDSD